MSRVVSIEARWSGPLPPPAALAGYERVVPGSADRILRLTEDQVKHRRDLERMVVETSTTVERRGQWLAFFIMLAAIAVGGWLIHDGNNGYGVAVVFGALAVIGGTFIYSRRQQQKDLNERRAELDLADSMEDEN